MSDNGTSGSAAGGDSMLGKLIFWTVVVVAGLFILRFVFAAVSIAVFLAFRLLPIVLVAYGIYWFWKKFTDKPE